MRIITWNCNGAFRKKAEFILKCNPDILVVPECEHPDKLKFKNEKFKPTDSLWFGINQNKKGLGIFSFSDYRITLISEYNPNFRWVIPIAVTGGQHDLMLYAIWTNNPDDKDGQYIEQVWKAIHFYDVLLTLNTTLFIGDFNSNSIWDRPKRAGNHSSVVKYLEEKNIYSTYHVYHKQQQGKENHPTLYWQKNKNKPYHIDYCFASAELIKGLHSVEVGDFDEWIDRKSVV